MTMLSKNTLEKPVAYLLALDSSISSREYEIRKTGLIIGRDQERCDIVISGETISRQHVRINKDENGAFFATDLQSTNGIFVNKQKVDRKISLSDGDVVGLGSALAHHFQFQHQSTRKKAVFSQLPAQENWTVGRSDTVDISLSFDPTVSSSHARIHVRNNKLIIEDLGSLNGTYLNGQKINRAKLKDTDSVVVGSSYFHFRITENNSLSVSRRESGGDIHLECIALKRDVSIGRGKKKRILHDITLQISPGEFVGILGPSGAGKSSLLKSIGGHTAPDTGCVLLNEIPLYRSYDMFRSLIGYVPQDDILHSELSVEKSLEYLARLRLPRDIDSVQRDKIIHTTVEALGLSHVKDTKIQQLSGGQRKRVSIGAELITRPSILFLDEPTSGLDPSVEERLMRHFQNMAQQGTTILITTHILYNLSMLDKIIFMAQGRLVFYGTPTEALEFFNDDGVNLTGPTQIFDLLEGLLEKSVGETPTGDNDNKEAIAEYYSQKYLDSSYFEKHIPRQLSILASDTYTSAKDESLKGENKSSSLQKLLNTPQVTKWSLAQLKQCCSYTQWMLLSLRHLQIRFSSVKQSLIYFLIPLVLALVTLTQTMNGFLDDDVVSAQRQEVVDIVSRGGEPVERQLQLLLSADGEVGDTSAADLIHAIKHEGVVNLPIPMGVLLMFVMTATFMGTFISCQEISPEKTIRHREQMSGQHIFDYIGSKLTFCLLVTAVQCTAYLGLCYLGSELRPVPFQDLLPVLILLAWTSVAMGLFLSAIDPSSGQFSIILAIIVVLPQLILSGGLGPDFYGSMHEVSQFIANCLPARWGLELFLTATYSNDAGAPLTWIPGFVTNTIGFDFGPLVTPRDMLILIGQMGAWLLVTVLVLKRKSISSSV